MIRKIIEIDQEKCNGCGACAKACHEGAISMVNGKATLMRDDYCDGLGDCLPACPADAIHFVEREALAYDEAAVMENKRQKQPLKNWPVQIKLAPVKTPYFDGADLLIAADCTAFAVRDFHDNFVKNRITLIGCPKLDMVDYAEKLGEILKNNEINSVTVVRMEVPCCGGLTMAVKRAMESSGKRLPWQVVTLSTEGSILEE